jgi:hypothetical protein
VSEPAEFKTIYVARQIIIFSLLSFKIKSIILFPSFFYATFRSWNTRYFAILFFSLLMPSSLEGENENPNIFIF